MCAPRAVLHTPSSNSGQACACVKLTCCPGTNWPKQMRWMSRAPLLCGAQARHVHAQYSPAASRTYLQMQRGSPIAQRMHMQLQCLLREAV